MATIVLYNIPEMDITYENIPFFESKSAQTSWINGHPKIQLDAKISVDPTRTTVTIALSYCNRSSCWIY